MNLIKSNLFIILLALSFLGFLDSVYLTILHYKNAFPPCSITSGCEKVLTSAYSMLGPMPIALFGSIFYPLVFVGFIVSVILFGVQAFILRSFCQYCVISEIISFLIFGFTFLLWKKK